MTAPSVSKERNHAFGIHIYKRMHGCGKPHLHKAFDANHHYIGHHRILSRLLDTMNCKEMAIVPSQEKDHTSMLIGTQIAQNSLHYGH